MKRNYILIFNKIMKSVKYLKCKFIYFHTIKEKSFKNINKSDRFESI